MNALPDERGCRRKLFSFLFIFGSCSFSLAVCQIAQTARIVGTETSLPAHIAGTLFVIANRRRALKPSRSNQRLLGANRMSVSNDPSCISRAGNILLERLSLERALNGTTSHWHPLFLSNQDSPRKDFFPAKGFLSWISDERLQGR